MLHRLFCWIKCEIVLYAFRKKRHKSDKLFHFKRPVVAKTGGPWGENYVKFITNCTKGVKKWQLNCIHVIVSSYLLWVNRCNLFKNILNFCISVNSHTSYCYNKLSSNSIQANTQTERDINATIIFPRVLFLMQQSVCVWMFAVRYL